MTFLNEKTFGRRSYWTLILVILFAIVIFCISLGLLVAFSHSDEKIQDHPMNVLFIVVDDLRPTLGCYGDDRAITPNIDQLAAKSILFNNTFSQQALCAPSRTSFLTSRRPDSLHLYDNTGKYWRDAVWNFTTLPEHFKYNGYETVSVGKIFHHGRVSNNTDDYPYSWSRVPYHPPTQKEKMAKVCPSPSGFCMNLFCPVEVDKQPGGSLPDIQVAEYAVSYLRNRSYSETKDEPFFLAVGFYKPHIPFKFPTKYLDLYPIDSMDLAPYNTKPKNMPEVAWNPWTDLRRRDDVKELNISFPYGPIPDDFQKRIRQGYYASVSYMDDQLGKVLEALELSGYGSNTMIVFLGDHGWSLGEHGEWSKYSNFEISTKVPLLMYIPDLTEKTKDHTPFKHIQVVEKNPPNYENSKAKLVANEFVELVDLFPTLSEIAKLPVPFVCPLSENTSFCSEGVSLFPLIHSHIVAKSEFEWKSAVFSQYPRPSKIPQNDSDQPTLDDINIMGYSLRDVDFRYTRWVHFNNSFFHPRWSNKFFVDHELYDKVHDPFEVHNLVYNENYTSTSKYLFRLLKKGWRNALPEEIFGD